MSGAGVTLREVVRGRAHDPDAADKACWLRCEPCDHIWAAAYWPMDAAKFAKILGRAICPKCGERKMVFLAKQADGVLLEPGAD